MFSKIKSWFVTGLLVLMPLGVTFMVVKFLLDKVGRPASLLFFGSWGQALNRQWLEWIASAISIAIVIVLITIFGWLSKFFFGRFLLLLTEKCIKRIPFIRAVYGTVKQIVDTLGKSNKAVFQKAVLVPFPSEGVYSVGFLTGCSSGETQAKTQETVWNIFVPTTPNPTSGFLIMVPKERVITLEMSVGDAIKLIISGGSVTPEALGVKPNGACAVTQPPSFNPSRKP
jgi:uncharacterized membrane protein